MTHAPALLPERRTLCGPVTARTITRTCVLYALVFLVGLAFAQLAVSPQWKAFGLGLMAPGGGFLAHVDLTSSHGVVHLAAAGLALSLFVGSLVMWFATGNALAPPALWLGAALAASSMEHGEVRSGALPLVSMLVAGTFALAACAALAWRTTALARRQAANEYLARHREDPAARYPGDTEVGEFTPHDLKRMRFLLDRALQPTRSYEGFEWLDQFQTAAVRYQLNFMGYALSLAQATRLPALRGYLDEAQRRLIEKQTDHRIWRYWALENLWGNLARDPDPVARENIMFTGFCAAQIALFHAASGVHEFERPGSLVLRHPSGQTFPFDLTSLIDALQREYARSAFCLVACEPNWIYPLCNTIAAAAVKGVDAQSGSRRWPALEHSFRRHLEEEFIDLAARFVPCRSAYSGFALPAVGGAQPQAMPSFFLNAILPDIALRQWLLLRRTLIEDGNTRRALRRGSFWRIDTGNYRFSRAAGFAATALAAVEMGDAEIAGLCLAALDEECPAHIERDALYRPQASVWAHAVEFFARSGGHNAFRRLIEHPRPVNPMPSLQEVPYPHVLIARAVHNENGLTAVLYPGGRPGRHRLGLSGLVPAAAYFCDGAAERRIVADVRGTAAIHLVLDGRRELRIRRAL